MRCASAAGWIPAPADFVHTVSEPLAPPHAIHPRAFQSAHCIAVPAGNAILVLFMGASSRCIHGCFHWVDCMCCFSNVPTSHLPSLYKFLCVYQNVCACEQPRWQMADAVSIADRLYSCCKTPAWNHGVESWHCKVLININCEKGGCNRTSFSTYLLPPV